MEKQDLLNKFYSIAPFLENIDNFGWEPVGDGGYKISPDYDKAGKDHNQWFKSFHLNIVTGVHSKYSYFDESGMRTVEASL